VAGNQTARIQPNVRMPHLEGLRGICALVIVVSHCLSAWLPALAFGSADPRVPELVPFAHTPLAIIWSGDTAVMIFFVLQGLLLAQSCERLTSEGQGFGAIIVRRSARLAVPVGAALIFTGGLFHFGAMHNQQAAVVSRSVWLASFYADGPRPGLAWSSVGGSILTGSDWWIGPLWSMHVQFFGSLLVFALIALLRNDRRANLALGCVVAWAIVAGSPRFGVYFGAIVSGVLLHRLLTGRLTVQRSAVRSFWRLFVIGLGVVGIVYLGSWPDEAQVGPWYEPVARLFTFTDDYLRPRAFAHTAAAVGVVWFALTLSGTQRTLRNRVVRSIGRLSFSIYLVHWAILMSGGAFVFSRLAPATSSLYLGAAVASTATLVLTVAGAALFRHVVEVPSVRFSEWLSRWWSNPSPRTEVELADEAGLESGWMTPTDLVVR
jgi:peptidoglycan/LPS O-acetylase OafA/YrhL